MSTFFAGSNGFDGMLLIKPDGRLYVQSGIRNFGSESVSDVHRVSAELLGVPWENVELTWGDTSRLLPWTCISGGSRTTHAMTRAAHAAASDAKEAADDCGTDAGRTSGVVSGRGRARLQWRSGDDARAGRAKGDRARRRVRRSSAARGHQRAHQEGGGSARGTGPHGRGARHVSGRRHAVLVRRGLRGSGSRRGTGHYALLDYLGVADVGTVLHPRSLGGQILGRSMLGIAHAIGQKWVYDQHYGVTLARRFYENRPPTILDAPQHMQWDALNIPDPGTPVGSRGIGEPPVAAGCNAVLNALIDAVGENVIRRAPVSCDMILTSLETGRPAATRRSRRTSDACSGFVGGYANDPHQRSVTPTTVRDDGRHRGPAARRTLQPGDRASGAASSRWRRSSPTSSTPRSPSSNWRKGLAEISVRPRDRSGGRRRLPALQRHQRGAPDEIHPRQGVAVALEKTNEANGLTRDLQGRIVSAEHLTRRVTRTQADGSITVVANSFQGKRLLRPNDVVVKSDGSM